MLPRFVSKLWNIEFTIIDVQNVVNNVLFKMIDQSLAIKDLKIDYIHKKISITNFYLNFALIKNLNFFA